MKLLSFLFLCLPCFAQWPIGVSFAQGKLDTVEMRRTKLIIGGIYVGQYTLYEIRGQDSTQYYTVFDDSAAAAFGEALHRKRLEFKTDAYLEDSKLNSWQQRAVQEILRDTTRKKQ